MALRYTEQNKILDEIQKLLSPDSDPCACEERGAEDDENQALARSTIRAH